MQLETPQQAYRLDSSHGPPDEVDLPETSASLSNLIWSLRRHWKVVAFCVAFGGLVGMTAALLPRHYTAVSRIQVRPGSSSQYRVDKSDLLNLGDDSTKLETETLILQSDTLLLDVARKLQLDRNPDFVGRLSSKDELQGPKADDKLLERLHESIHVALIPRSEMMQISCNSKSPILSARVVNTVVAEYIQRLFESRFSSTQRVAKWLSGQLDDLKQRVEDDQEKLIQLQSRLGIVGIDQNHDLIVTELEDLTKSADEARVQRIVAEARFRILSSGDLNLLEGGQDIAGRGQVPSSQLSLLANLRNQKAQAESRYAGLSAEFGSRYSEVLQAEAELATLNREIQQEQNRVLTQAHQSFDAAVDDEKKTVATLEDKKQRAFKQRSDLVQYQILVHDYESDRSLYEGLMQRLRQAGIVAGLESSEVDVVDMARVPGRPSELSRSVAVALGLLLGILTGVMVAFLVDHFDQRLGDLAAIESRLGLSLLSITTNAKGIDQLSSKPIGDRNFSTLFADLPNSEFVESMWSLRASLLLSTPGHPPRTILFTSCRPGEGKTTIACGQACALALRDARVLLIDGDMRRSTIARRFALRNDVGLSSILTGAATIESALQRIDGMPMLSILTSGPTPPSAPLILASQSMSDLMSSLRERFDFIVIDSPPLLGMVDSSVFGQFAEAIVLVLSFSSLDRAQILRARRVMQRVDRSFTGIALNFADEVAMGNSKYGYGKYYRSYEADEKR